jgi:hypothetical protein
VNGHRTERAETVGRRGPVHDRACPSVYPAPRTHGRRWGADAQPLTRFGYPDFTREQRDCLHKLGNILDKLPKRLLLRVKAALREVMYAGTHTQVREAVRRFPAEYGPKCC